MKNIYYKLLKLLYYRKNKFLIKIKYRLKNIDINLYCQKHETLNKVKITLIKYTILLLINMFEN